MVTLTIDNETYQALRRQAAERGLSVEDWLKSQSRVAPPNSSHGEGWQHRLLAFGRRHQSTGVPLDTSREAIYD